MNGKTATEGSNSKIDTQGWYSLFMHLYLKYLHVISVVCNIPKWGFDKIACCQIIDVAEFEQIAIVLWYAS